MSEFLFIVPQGWTQLDLDQIVAIPGVSVPAIQNWIANNQLDTITISLIDGGVLPAGSTILDAKIFNGETFVVVLG